MWRSERGDNEPMDDVAPFLFIPLWELNFISRIVRSHSTPINLEPGEKACSHRTAAGVLRRYRPGVLKSPPFFGTGAWAHPGARVGQTYRAAQTLESGSPDSHAGMRGARSRHPSDVGGRPTRGCGRGHGRCQSRSRACPHARRRTRRPLMKERSDIYLAPRWSGIGH